MTEEPEEGMEEENVYKEESREDLVDNDELSPEEEAFMKGYDEDSEEKSEGKKEEEEGS